MNMTCTPHPQACNMYHSESPHRVYVTRTLDSLFAHTARARTTKKQINFDCILLLGTGQTIIATCVHVHTDVHVYVRIHRVSDNQTWRQPRGKSAKKRGGGGKSV